MCIIAAIPSKQQVSKATLRRCWENNPHGGGFMYTDGKRVQIFKEMSSFKRYWKAFVDAKDKFPESAFVCHFRISTHGKINETNCHPFHVNNKLGFAHNGIIRNAPCHDDYSDTFMFNEHILKPLPDGFLSNSAITSLIKEYIGSGSKLAFLSSANQITLINEKAGEWSDGVWFSNGGYKEPKYYDAGGTRISTDAYSNSSWYSKRESSDSYSQGRIGFVTASKKQTEEKKAPTLAGFADRYKKHCIMCGCKLGTYKEKQEELCTRCVDKYSLQDLPF